MAKAPHPNVQALKAIADRVSRDLPGHNSALQLQAQVNRLRAGAEALDNLASSRSPIDTPEAHALKVAKMARKFDNEVTSAINRIGGAAGDGLRDVQRRIDEKVNLKPDAFAGEIRAAFRALDGKAQMEQLSQWMKDGSGPEMAAVVKAPPFLSGISEQTRATFEKGITNLHAAAEVEEMAKLNEAFDASMIAVRTAGAFASVLFDPSNIASIERGAAESDAALQAFNQSLAPE